MRFIALATVLVPGLSAAQSPSPSREFLAVARPEFSGNRAKETVAFLDKFVRWPGNAGFDAGIAHIVQGLEQAGYKNEVRATHADRLVYRVERYPMANPAWEPLASSVSIVGDSIPLLEWATNRNMLAINSFATRPEGVTAQLVDVGSGAPAILDSVGVKGKIVFARTGLGRLFGEAVRKRGALGVLAYALPHYLQPSTNRHSIQFGAIPYDTTAKGWGIAVSQAAHDRLVGALAHGPVSLHVVTDVHWTPNATEQTVVAEVRGRARPDERFVFSAHLQEPGANDNASGVGAQLEIARVAAVLSRSGKLNPDRTITMLWGDEIRSTTRFVQQDTGRARGIKWGMALDMVGEDTKVTGGTFLIEKMPDPSAIWTRGADRHSEWGGSPITKDQLKPHYFNDFVEQRCRDQASENGWTVATNPFEGGSDHTPFLQANKPGLLLWHFTDQFYHTDGDRIDKVSPSELRNVGLCALTTAALLTSPSRRLVTLIIAELERVAVARLNTEGALGAAALVRGEPVEKERDIVETWARYYHDVLGAVPEIELGAPSPVSLAAVRRAQNTVRVAATRVLARDLNVRR